VIKKTKLARLELSNEKSIPFYERLTSIVRFLYYTVSQHLSFDDDRNIRYLFFCTIARKNKTRIASVIEEVITDPYPVSNASKVSSNDSNNN
jgi:hypothetical protein